MSDSAATENGPVEYDTSPIWMAFFRPSYDVFSDHAMVSCTLCGWDWTATDDSTLGHMASAAEAHFFADHPD